MPAYRSPHIPLSGGLDFLDVTLEDGTVVETMLKFHPLAAAPPGPAHYMETGRIIIPRSQDEIEAVIARWRQVGAQPIAHDLECAASPTAPNGTGLHPHLGTIRLAQFGVADGGDGRAEALVVDCWRHDPSSALSLLADKDYPTIIHFAQMETKFIGYRYGLRIENLIDTRQASKLIYDRYGFTGKPLDEDIMRIAKETQRITSGEGGAPRAGIRHALGLVAQRDLGLELDKSQQNSYWDAVRLTAAQQKYAGEDVLSLLDLHRRFEPLLDDDIREKMAESAYKLNTKYAGMTPTQVDEFNSAASRGEIFLKAPATVVTPEDKGCERDRALRMIASSRSEAELDRFVKAVPHMRIHFTNREQVQRALTLRRRALRRAVRQGVSAPRPAKVRVAGWRQPF